MNIMIDWLADHRKLLWIAGTLSAAIFLASLLIVPALIVRIRADYFDHSARPATRWVHQPRFIRAAISTGKNLAGAVLMVAGLAMLVLPGQGLLTLLVGFLLVDFPHKYRLEKWLISRRYIIRPINWLRTRSNREPLRVAA